MEFNRRLQAVQMTIVSASLGLFIVIGQNRAFTFSPKISQLALLALIWMAFAFSTENISNNSHIALAAQFMHVVLNRKYKLGDGTEMIYDWELYLSSERQHSKKFFFRNFFFLDAAFTINILMTLIAVFGYYHIIVDEFSKVNYVFLIAFCFGFLATCASYQNHFYSAAPLQKMISKAEINKSAPPNSN